MKNRVENLFLTKIRATFVLSNVGFPTLIDLTNLTREIPCREARVSSFMYGREPPRARGFPQDCGFCARAAGSAPGPRVLLRGCGFYSGAADFTPGLRIPIYITGGGACTGPCRRGKAHKPVSDRGTRPLCRGGAHKLVSDRGTRPLCRGWVGVRALFKQDARILCRRGAYRSFANRVHGPYRRGGAYRSFAGMAHGAEGPERPGRKAFAAGCKRKERFHAENPIFFSIFASIGKIVNLNAEAV